jgi:tetratricopeptide (TPR) repeat protein
MWKDIFWPARTTGGCIMRRFSNIVLLLAAAFLQLVPRADAQSAVLDLPRDSQHATVEQRVGLTDITINYHRPLVKGRKIWGGLIPYGEVWRAGANENTTITFSDPVTVEGKALPKGTYGLHMIPGQNEWTIAFSKNATSWGSYNYNQAEDALRIAVKPQPSDFHEALTYEFTDVKPDSTVVTLAWDKLAVPFTIGVNTSEIVQQSLNNQLRGLAQYTWEGWDDAATYLLDHKGDLQTALKYEERSLQVEPRFDNLITKSRILEALGRKDESASVRDRAIGMANAQQLHSYGRQLQTLGKQDEAFEIFRINMKKNPENWLVHSEVARMACAKGDFDSAVKEMKVAAGGAPDQQKPFFESLVKRLQAKEDINK